MQIGSISTAYGGSEAQRLLASLFQQQGPPAGQDLPSDPTASASNAPAPPAAPPPANPPGPSQFATATLASLLNTQQAPPTSSDIAHQVIAAADTDGDGSLTLDEVEKALGQDSSTAANGLSQAFAQLDTNGDGKLSQDELASAIDAQNASGGTSGVHHHHHHHHAQQAQGTDASSQSSDGQLASAILGAADTNGDGALSADEIANALGTTASDGLKQQLAAFDKDGDGKLDSSELAAAIDAFRTANSHAQTSTPTDPGQTQAVTA
jgi:Ca2+-binding EF-hand superfamily protein